MSQNNGNVYRIARTIFFTPLYSTSGNRSFGTEGQFPSCLLPRLTNVMTKGHRSEPALRFETTSIPNSRTADVDFHSIRILPTVHVLLSYPSGGSGLSRSDPDISWTALPNSPCLPSELLADSERSITPLKRTRNTRAVIGYSSDAQAFLPTSYPRLSILSFSPITPPRRHSAAPCFAGTYHSL